MTLPPVDIVTRPADADPGVRHIDNVARREYLGTRKRFGSFGTSRTALDPGACADAVEQQRLDHWFLGIPMRRALDHSHRQGIAGPTVCWP